MPSLAAPRMPHLTQLVLLVVFMVMYPVAEELPLGGAFIEAYLFVSIALGLWWLNAPTMAWRCFLAAVGALFVWVVADAMAPDDALASIVLDSTSSMIEATVFATAMLVTLRKLVKSPHIRGDHIFGTVNAYLLMALVFAELHYVTERFYPGSFGISGFEPTAASNRHGLPFFPFLYYSITTLTTTGFGDIVPRNTLSRILTNLESIVGQFYIAILVARLVGMHLNEVAQASRDDAPDQSTTT